MKVEASPPQPPRLFDTPSADIPDKGFATVLAQIDAEAGSTANPAISAASIAPQVGESAVSFASKPFVLLSAVEFDRPEELFAKGSAFLEEGISHLPKTNFIGVMSLPVEGAEDVPPPNSQLDISAKRSAAESRLAGTPRASAAPRPQPLPPGQTITGGPSEQQGTSVRGPAPMQGNDAAADLSGPDRSVATKSTELSPARGAILANLLAVENGFRLILRTPAMKNEDRAELIGRLAKLFAEHGRTLPELLIYQPDTPQEG